MAALTRRGHLKAYYKVWLATGTILLFLFVLSKVEAQPTREKTAFAKPGYTHSFDFQAYSGFIIEHAPSVAHLVSSHPHGIQLDFRRHTYGTRDWEAIYNYPDVGLALTWVDYRNEVLGKSLGVIGFYDFYLLRKERHTLTWRVGFGGGYHTTPYDRTENNQNTFLGSSFTFALQSNLTYRLNITPQWQVNTGLMLTHFSNGATAKPNKGINVPAVKAGVSYRLESTEPDYIPKASWEMPAKRWHLNLLVSGGKQAIEPLGLPSYPFIITTAYADYRASQRSGLQLGVEGFFSKASREAIKWDQALEDGESPDYRRVGLVAGHEFFMNKLSLVAQVGAYVYAPYNRDKPGYQRYGIKYYVKEGLFGSLMLKTHLANADAVEFGIGYRL